jgi:hypothetical protein
MVPPETCRVVSRYNELCKAASCWIYIGRVLQIRTIYSETQLSNFIKVYFLHLDDKKIPKRVLQWKPIGTRTRGGPRKRWTAGIVEEYLQIMGVRRWRKQCEERAEWKKITEKVKIHSGL